MKQKIYTVHDVAIAAYMQPFFARTHGEAIRSFEAACGNPQHEFAKNAKDYTLFYIGDYDEETAHIEPCLTPTPLAKALEVIARQASAA